MIDEYFDAVGFATEDLNSFLTITDLFDAAEDFHENVYLKGMDTLDDIRSNFRDYCAEHNYNDVEQKLLAEALVEHYFIEAVSIYLD